jgi:hypothetical protein
MCEIKSFAVLAVAAAQRSSSSLLCRLLTFAFTVKECMQQQRIIRVKLLEYETLIYLCLSPTKLSLFIGSSAGILKNNSTTVINMLSPSDLSSFP